MTTGYQPAFAFIGRQPVFIEGRGGNTPAAYRMDETLEKCFDGLKANNIHIEHFRSDSAAYQKDIVDVADTPFLLEANDLIVRLYKEEKEKTGSMICLLKALILITPL